MCTTKISRPGLFLLACAWLAGCGDSSDLNAQYANRTSITLGTVFQPAQKLEDGSLQWVRNQPNGAFDVRLIFQDPGTYDVDFDMEKPEGWVRGNQSKPTVYALPTGKPAEDKIAIGWTPGAAAVDTNVVVTVTRQYDGVTWKLSLPVTIRN